MPFYLSIISEFETPEQEARYTGWLQAKTAASITSPRPEHPARRDRATHGRATSTAQAAQAS
ncbi:antitoxin PaaA2 family protein [Acidithiobacillus concretivorus]|uniref:antitoxin PaaA2 family protein n=1 Tax=Acidithiobacillus concretivorus TaxID=3063952 RepID=UPI0034A5A643